MADLETVETRIWSFQDLDDEMAADLAALLDRLYVRCRADRQAAAIGA